jgi:transposase InsO family protein
MWQADLVRELNCYDDTAKVIDAFCRQTGLAPATIYRTAKKYGWKSNNKRRKDKGTAKSEITKQQITYIAGLLETTARENKGPIMPVETALDIAIDNGIIEQGQVSVSTMQRLLREHNMSKEQLNAPSPHTEMRSLHPNYCHLVDVSVCIQYYLKNGTMKIMDERDFYKNKPHNFAKIKQKLLRYVLDDHFSGYFAFRYYVADGESRENLWDFLKWAWRAKGDSRYPLRGVPFYLLMDAGSAQTSHAMRNFFDGLGIERPKGKPYNPRRQGAVETVHNIIETRFETRLRISPAHTVEELNEWAFDFTIHHHATKIHRRHGMTRLASWLLIKQEQLREMPEDDVLNMIYVEPEAECPVRGYRLTYRGCDYNLKCIEGLPARCKVKVRLNPYLWKIDQSITVIWDDTAYEIKAIGKLSAEQGAFSENAAIIGQEYRAQPETSTQKSKKEIKEMAYGTQEPKKGSVPFAGTVVFGHQADKVANLATLAKQGMPISIDRSIVDRQIPIHELFKRLVREVGAITPELNKQLRAEYGDTISFSTAEELIDKIAAGEWDGGSSHLQQQAL